MNNKNKDKKYFTKPVDSTTINKINGVISGLSFQIPEKKDMDINKFFVKKK
jgi:hypothetical protein